MNNITKYYNKKMVLNNISFEINKQCTLVVGQNESGKTTLFKILAGLIKNYNGNVDFDIVSLKYISLTRLFIIPLSIVLIISIYKFEKKICKYI